MVYIKKNDTFILEDQNGILTAGTWSSTDTQLSLNGSNGDTFVVSV